MILPDIEIGRHDWSSLACGCGMGAEHLAQDLRTLASAISYEQAQALRLSDHVLIQSFPQEPAPIVTSVLMSILASNISSGSKVVALDLLLRLISNDDDESSENCRGIARQGLWLLYSELLTSQVRGVVSNVFRILRELEQVPSRLEAVKLSGAIELPNYLM